MLDGEQQGPELYYFVAMNPCTGVQLGLLIFGVPVTFMVYDVMCWLVGVS